MLVLGIDEAGRGPVIGSMMICGVLLDSDLEGKLARLGVKDSKLLSPQDRERLAREIRRYADEIHVIEITAKEIDSFRRVMSLNEIEARAVSSLIGMFKKKPDRIIIDCPDPEPGRFILRLKKYVEIDPSKLVVEHKADLKYVPVSAASIIAKVERDKHVRDLEKKHNVRLGTGYSHDENAIKAINEYYEKNGKLPPYARKSWDTSKRIIEKKTQKKLDEFTD